MRPAVNGILESALYVEDMDRSVGFYETVFGFRSLFRDHRICAMSVANKQVFLIFKKGASDKPARTPGGIVPGSDGSGHLHMAFSIALPQLDEWRTWLEENGVEIESTVRWNRGGTSLYFRDPDDHVIELVTPGTWEIF